jgi:hypothetical protein
MCKPRATRPFIQSRQQPIASLQADVIAGAEFRWCALQRLWGATLHADAGVREAAFAALLRFPHDEMLTSYGEVIKCVS